MSSPAESTRATLRERLLFLFPVVTLGFSQALFSQIKRFVTLLPTSGPFFLYTLAFCLLLPTVLLLGLDLGIRRLWSRPLVLRCWDTLLLSLLLFSLMLQCETDLIYRLPLELPWSPPLHLLAFVLIVGVSFRIHRALMLWVRYMNLFALVVIALFIHSRIQNLPEPETQKPPTSPLSADAPPDAIVLVLDSLSADSLGLPDGIDRERFPAFHRLAQEATVLKHSVTNHFNTTHSIHSMMSGRLNPEFQTPTLIRRVGEHHDVSLLETMPFMERWLRESVPAGEHLRFLRGNPALPDGSPAASAHLLLSVLVDGYVPPQWRLGPISQERLECLVHLGIRAQFESLLEDLRHLPPQPHFLYAHIVLPHPPFHFDRTGAHRLRSRNSRQCPSCSHPALPIPHAYCEQLEFVDHLLNPLLDVLDSTDRGRRTILVVTSDHGFRRTDVPQEDQPQRVPGLSARVPLFLRAPALPPEIAARKYQHIDLLPTLLELLGYAPESAVEGMSLLSPEVRPDPSVRMGDLPLRLDPQLDLWLPDVGE